MAVRVDDVEVPLHFEVVGPEVQHCNHLAELVLTSHVHYYLIYDAIRVRVELLELRDELLQVLFVGLELEIQDNLLEHRIV